MVTGQPLNLARLSSSVLTSCIQLDTIYEYFTISPIKLPVMRLQIPELKISFMEHVSSNVIDFGPSNFCLKN